MASETPAPAPTGLRQYRLLGRSGLRVSPLSLGTGTFGQAWGPGWSSEKAVARRIWTRYLEAGGNFIDTANGYQDGESEEWIGEFLQTDGGRDRLVIATKATFGKYPGDPNGGGNGRKHLIEACEASLRRLGTDHIDLYWLHAWDMLTPVEEVVSTLDRLVQQGKVRYIGLSNVPGWYVGRAVSLAEQHGWERICALQVEYSLITRETEWEYGTAAKAFGLGLCPWSPLANGLLTGKYRKTEAGLQGDGRLGKGGFSTGVNSDLRERNQRIVEAVVAAARQLGKTPAQVALAWVNGRPGVSSTIIGVTKLEQLEDNLGALDVELPASILSELEQASAMPLQYPQGFFIPGMQSVIRNETSIRPTTW
jgi:aryl-alcohol dehydrogenase-like predicted oxidoreductase